MRVLRLIGIILSSLFIVIWLMNVFVFGHSGLIQLTNPVFLGAIILLAFLVLWRRKHEKS